MRGKRAAANDRDDEPGHDDPGPIPPAWTVDAPDLPSFDQFMIHFWKQSSYRTEANPIVTLDLIRVHAPRAWDWLMLNDTEASGIAIRRDWLRPKTRTIPDAEEIAAVAALVEGLGTASPDGPPKHRPALEPALPPTRRQLAVLLETYRRAGATIPGAALRVAMLTEQLAAMDAPPTESKPEPVPEPEMEDDEPWVPSALAA